MEGLNAEHCKMWLMELRKTISEDSPVHAPSTRRINVVKMFLISKKIYRFSEILFKLSAMFPTDIEKKIILEISVEPQKTSNSQSNLE